MAVSEKKSRIRRLIRFACYLLSLCALGFIAFTVISGRGSEILDFFGLLSGRGSEMAEDYYFDVGRDRGFAYIGESVAAAGTLGVQGLGTDGSETFGDSFQMVSPCVVSSGEYGVAFDIGGTAVRAFGNNGIYMTLQTEGSIVSASINRNGWVSVCTQDEGSLKGVVYVYNAGGNAVYKVSLVSGYALSSVVSHDNRSVAILGFTDNGSRITVYNIDSVEVNRVFDLQGGLILSITYLPGGDILAVSTQALFVVTKDNESRELYGFSGRLLGGFAVEDDTASVYLRDYSVGHRGRLIALSADGETVLDIETDREIVSMSVRGGYLAVLKSDGPDVYDLSMKTNVSQPEEPPGESVSHSGAEVIISMGNGHAIVAGDHFSVVY